jgi:hypothetical protein
MSLLVDVFVIGDDGEMNLLDVPDGCSDMAGFENWRKAVWGSTAVRSLGARFFPDLAEGDLTVAPEQMSDFLVECALIRRNLEAVAPRRDPAVQGDGHVRQVSERLANIEDAGERARKSGGGVIIW